MKISDLRKYARLIVRTGANVQKGQPVVIFSSVSDEYFTKLVVEEAYKAKASIVDVEWHSDEVTKRTYKYAKLDALKELPESKVLKMKERSEKLPALIHIESSDPDALASIDQNKMMEVRRYQGPILKPFREAMENKHQWTIVAIPSEAWAQKIFPNLSKKAAFNALWDAIFKCTRVYGDPTKNWEEHNRTLQEKCDYVNSLGIKTLTYKSANGTDFKVDLLANTHFEAGSAKTLSGVVYNPNMPTEECFTSPNRHSAEGIVYATKPLSVNGVVVHDWAFRFHEGKIVEVISDDKLTKDTLETLIHLDEGACQLGEVALVPFNSPINETGLLFYNTLFDENACCHLAFGMAFEEVINGFDTMSKEEIKAYDLNDSIIHIDFMIGARDLNITATLFDGREVPIFREGTWAF